MKPNRVIGILIGELHEAISAAKFDNKNIIHPNSNIEIHCMNVTIFSWLLSYNYKNLLSNHEKYNFKITLDDNLEQEITQVSQISDIKPDILNLNKNFYSKVRNQMPPCARSIYNNSYYCELNSEKAKLSYYVSANKFASNLVDGPWNKNFPVVIVDYSGDMEYLENLITMFKLRFS